MSVPRLVVDELATEAFDPCRRPAADARSPLPVKLSTTLFNETYTFPSVKDVLGRANEPRSGDVQAGLAARTMREMAAAKLVVADLTMKELRENPSVPYETDEVTRVIEDDLQKPQAARAYKKICGWSVAELREWILDNQTTGEDVSAISFGLSPEMAAAVAKLMSNMDLVLAGQKIRVVARCNNTIGLTGRISSRLQPQPTRAMRSPACSPPSPTGSRSATATPSSASTPRPTTWKSAPTS